MRTRAPFFVLAGLALLAGPASAGTIDWVLVGQPGNPPDAPSTNCYAGDGGAVADAFRIAESGSPGSYTCAVKSGVADKPVNWVSFWDALRFTNWLHNGQGDRDTERDDRARGAVREAKALVTMP